MPELTNEQLASFRRVTAKEHKRLRDGKIRKVGRPPKPADEKEVLVSIRFPPRMLAQLKAKARSQGYKGWQTYTKELLKKALGG